MSILTVYRMLLCLYPYSFRRQFAEEMIEVFRQKIQSLVAVKGLVFTSFVFHEFIGLLLGAARSMDDEHYAPEETLRHLDTDATERSPYRRRSRTEYH